MKTLLAVVASAAITTCVTALVASAESSGRTDPGPARVLQIGDSVDMPGIDLRCRYLPGASGTSGSPSFTCQRRSLAVAGAVEVRGSLVDLGKRTFSVFPANGRVELLLAGTVRKTVVAQAASVKRTP